MKTTTKSNSMLTHEVFLIRSISSGGCLPSLLALLVGAPEKDPPIQTSPIQIYGSTFCEAFNAHSK